MSDWERGNTGSESSEDTVEAVGESGEVSLLSSAGPATGESGGGTGTRRAPAWDSRWPRCALWRYSRLGRTHADCEECGLQQYNLQSFNLGNIGFGVSTLE